MFRVIVTAVLVPALLLTQWVSAYRCGGCPTGKRESQPHVHMRGLLPTSVPESNCSCHRQGLNRKLQQFHGNESSRAVFTASLEHNKCIGQAETVLVLPVDPEACWGKTSHRQEDVESTSLITAAVSNTASVLRNATPTSRQFNSAAHTFPVELATRSLRI